MYPTVTAPVAGPAADRTTPRTTWVRPGLLGGIGGLVFAGAVIAQNAIRSRFPMNGATPQEVMRYAPGPRSAPIALSVLFPFGLVGLVTFLGAVVSRVAHAAGR